MIQKTSKLQPGYRGAHALIVGANKYFDAPQLEFAENDARQVASLLISEFDFQSRNVTLLLGCEATKQSIMSTFLAFDKRRVDENDKVFFFFAGHGHTESVATGEVGYLVPCDARFDDYSTLIRWDDLTRNADRIPAKHVFFVVDACYGGLAVVRSSLQSKYRYFQDITTRRARQVLAAGKADQPVADSGGPLPGHSVFSGFLLSALTKLAGTNDVLTASNLMAYVTEKVGTAPSSKQTPHFGQIEGDGDFVFRAPQLHIYSGHTHPLSRYRRKGGHPDAAITATIIDQLHDEDASVRALAVANIGRIVPHPLESDYAATKSLLYEPILDSDISVRREALRALCSYASDGDVACIAGLISSLHDDEPDIARLAAMCLGRIGAAAGEAIEPLIQFLEHDDAWVAEEAAYALRSICDDVYAELEHHEMTHLYETYVECLD